MTYLEHIVSEKTARAKRTGLAYRWLDALVAGLGLGLLLLGVA